MAKLRERFFAHPGPKLTYRLPGVCGIAYAPRLTIWARFPGNPLVLDKASIVTSIIMGIPGLVISNAPSRLSCCYMISLYGVRASTSTNLA